LVSFLEFYGIGQAVVAGLHLVTGHLQMLMGTIVDAVQPIHEVHVVGCRLLLVGGASNRCSSLPNTMLVGVVTGLVG
jgi:hypothetical protein